MWLKRIAQGKAYLEKKKVALVFFEVSSYFCTKTSSGLVNYLVHCKFDQLVDNHNTLLAFSLYVITF